MFSTFPAQALPDQVLRVLSQLRNLPGTRETLKFCHKTKDKFFHRVTFLRFPSYNIQIIVYEENLLFLSLFLG
jgi:hypothetical protein